MTYEHAIEQAVQRQLDIERKAAMWDELTRALEVFSGVAQPVDLRQVVQFLEATHAQR